VPVAAESPPASAKKKGAARAKQEKAPPGTEGQLSIFGE